MLQHSQLLCTYLHPADVGANCVRPRATKRRPYNFKRKIVVFGNTPLLLANLNVVAIYRLIPNIW